MTTGQPGLLEQGQRCRISLSRRTVLRDYWPEEAGVAAAELSVPQELRADREQRTPPSTLPGPQYLQGTTGLTDPLDGYAGVHRGKRPRDLPGAGRRVSTMIWIWAKLLHAD